MKNSYRIHQKLEALLEMKPTDPKQVRWVHKDSIEAGTQEPEHGVWHTESPGEGWVKASEYNKGTEKTKSTPKRKSKK